MAWGAGEGPASVFSALSHGEGPRESRGSARLQNSLFSDFMLWCFDASRFSWHKLFLAAHKTPVILLFITIIMTLLKEQQPPPRCFMFIIIIHARWSEPSLFSFCLPSLSHCVYCCYNLLFNIPNWDICFFPPSLSILYSSRPSSPLCSTLAVCSFALVPSLLLHHQFLHMERCVITFVIHRVSFIRSDSCLLLPPPPQEKKRAIEAFCHL